MLSPVDPFKHQIHFFKPRYILHTFHRVVDFLADLEQSGWYADKALDEYFKENRQLGSSDRRLYSDLVYAVARWRRRIDAALETAGVSITDANIHAARAALLLIASGNNRDVLMSTLDGFAPGVAEQLDGIERAATAFTTTAPDTAENQDELSVRASLPAWIVECMKRQYGWERTRAVAGACRFRAPVTIRTNTLEHSRDELLEALARESIPAKEAMISPWGIELDAPGPVRNTALFRNGSFEFQDEGSQLVALAVDARPGMCVVDACAGAGGKTLALAAVMENDGKLLAVDVSAPKLHELMKRVERAGVRIAETAVACSTRRLRRWRGTADRVLVDAPCSGSGTWRRIPDGPEHLTPEDLERYSRKQYKILDDYVGLVKHGGRLIYATCSVFEEENAAVVNKWLERHRDFSIIPVNTVLPREIPAESDI